MVSMNEQAPAGWYPDDQGQERYWDGMSWTPQVRDLQHAGSAEEMPKKDGAFGKMPIAYHRLAAVHRLGHHRLGRFRQQVADHDVRPLLGEPHGTRPADAVRPAGHHRHLILQPSHIAPWPSIGRRG